MGTGTPGAPAEVCRSPAFRFIHPAHFMKTHPGFKSVAKSVAAKENLPFGQAAAIIAAGARGASAKAKRANPRLKKVKG